MKATLKKVVDAWRNNATEVHAYYDTDSNGKIQPVPNGEGGIAVIGGDDTGYCIFIHADDGDVFCYPSETLNEALAKVHDIKVIAPTS